MTQTIAQVAKKIFMSWFSYCNWQINFLPDFLTFRGAWPFQSKIWKNESIVQSPSLPLECCICFMYRNKTKSMIKHKGHAKIKESIYSVSITRINSFIIKFNHVPEIQLSVRNATSLVSKRLTRFAAIIFSQLNMQEEFFCFECGMNFSEVEMRNTIGDWFGVCRRCTSGYNHTSEDGLNLI